MHPWRRYRDILLAMVKDAGTKNMLLRLDPELAERLQTVAEVEGRSVSDVAREAIAALVEQRRSDAHFSRLLEENLARHERSLRRLREDS
jgi:predicted transcriptional regulator